MKKKFDFYLVISKICCTFATELRNKKFNQLKVKTSMTTTNFNINKTDVYYTLINNEVYALRFKAILVDIPSLTERELYLDESDNKTDVLPIGNKMSPYYLNNSKMVLFDRHMDRKFSNIGIDYIAIEIAPLGEERVWKRWGNNHEKSFNPARIHRTIKDCVDNVNPVLIRHRDAKVWPTQSYVIPLNEITPDKKFMWENNGFNLYNHLVWTLKTWTWNGYRADKQRVRTVNNRMGYRNSYNNPVFDLLEGKFLFDEDLLEHAYSTEEECYKCNSIAVHLFIK